MSLEDLLKRVDEAGFTPGPWHAEGPDQFGDFNIHHERYRLAVAAVVSNMHPAEEVAANARLIAAAPDMFEALKAARAFVINSLRELVELPDFDPTQHVVVQKIDAALLRALISQKEPAE